jgi:hypothetical protein
MVVVLVDKLMKIELLAVLGQQLPEEEAIVKVFLEISNPPGELYLVVEPIQQ